MEESNTLDKFFGMISKYVDVSNNPKYSKEPPVKVWELLSDDIKVMLSVCFLVDEMDKLMGRLEGVVNKEEKKLDDQCPS